MRTKLESLFVLLDSVFLISGVLIVHGFKSALARLDVFRKGRQIHVQRWANDDGYKRAISSRSNIPDSLQALVMSRLRQNQQRHVVPKGNCGCPGVDRKRAQHRAGHRDGARAAQRQPRG